MWKFVQISDPHFAAQTDGCGNNLLIHSKMPEIVACLRRDLQALNPEFLLVTGDLAAYESRDAVYAARDMLDSLGVRYYPIGGNQDFQGPRARAWFIEAYHDHLPTPDTVYSFTHQNLHVAVLDPWWRWEDGSLCPHREDVKPAYRWSIPPHQFDWLREDLARNPVTPTVVALHYPVVPLPGRLKWDRMLEPESLENGQILREFLAMFPQVIAVMAGHAHMHYAVQDSHLVHVVTGALAEYPIEYRVIDVHDDRLEIATKGLSDETFAAHSLTPNGAGAAGHECDRNLVIPFRQSSAMTA
ncbi:MAG: metallophosphoesterase [Candidatus Hydrogenedentes bacterium]|nr:metallophosphoesterase [Candidatus Hydrogenedentota bacterium]